MKRTRHRAPHAAARRLLQRWIPRLGWTLVVLGLLLAAAHSLLFFGFTHYKVRERVEAELSQEWEHTVTIRRLRIGLFLNRIILSGIQVTEPTRSLPLLRLETLRLHLDPFALLSRRLTITRVTLSTPEADAEISRDGSSPFLDLLHRILTPPRRRRLLTPAISEVRIHNGGGRLTFPHRSLAISLRELDATLSLSPEKTLQGVTLRMAEAHIATPSLTRALTRISARTSVRGTTLTLSHAEAHLGESSLSLSGVIHSFATSPTLDLRAGLSLHLASLLPHSPPSSLPRSWEVKGTLTGPLTALQVEGSLPALSGTLHTAGSLRREDDHWAYRVTLTARDISLPLLLTLTFPRIPLPPLRGTVGGEFTLQGTDRDPIPSQGKGGIKSTDLTLPDAPAPATLESSFHLTSQKWILDTAHLRVPGPESEGTVEIRGTVDPSENSHLSLQARGVDLQLLRPFTSPADLSGLLDFTGTLDGSLTTPRGRGDFAVRKFAWSPVTIPHLVGTVETEKGRVTLTPLRALFGNTEATLTGEIEPPDPGRSWRDTRLALRVRIASGQIERVLPSFGIEAPVTGTASLEATLTGTLARPEGEGRLTARDLLLWGEPWREGSARFTVAGETLTLSPLSLLHGERDAPEQVEAQGTVRWGGPLDVRVTAHRLDLSRMEARERLPLTGQASLSASLRGTVRRPILQGTFSASDVRYKKIPLGDGRGSLSLSPERIQGQATFPTGGYQGEAEIEREGSQRYRLAVMFTEADLTPLLVFIDHPLFDGARGRATGALTLSGEKGVRESAQGSATFTLLELSVRGDHLVNTHPVALTLSEGRLQFTDFQMAGGEKKVTVQGSLIFGQEWDLTLTGQLGLGLLRAFLPTVEKASGMGRLSLLIRGYWDAPNLTGSLDVEGGEIQLEDVVPPLKKVRARTTFTRETTLLDSFEATLGDGALSATLRSDGHGSHARHALTLKLVGAGADEVLRGKEREGAVTGRLTLTATLTAQGKSAMEIQRSLSGQLSLVLEDGRIRRYVTLAKIYSLLSVSEDVFTRGIRYKTWTGDFTISEGVMETTNFFLEANTLEATTVGALHIPEKTLDLTVAIHPFPTLGNMIGNIPLLGYLLTGEKKSILTATFAVSGPWSNPEVSALGIQTLGQGLLDLLKRAIPPSAKTESPTDTPSDRNDN